MNAPIAPIVQHALMAVHALPDPGDLTRDDLPLLLAAVRGQKALTSELMGDLAQAIVDRDVEGMVELSARSREDSAPAHALMRPYYLKVEAMAQTPRPEA